MKFIQINPHMYKHFVEKITTQSWKTYAPSLINRFGKWTPRMGEDQHKLLSYFPSAMFWLVTPGTLLVTVLVVNVAVPTGNMECAAVTSGALSALLGFTFVLCADAEMGKFAFCWFCVSAEVVTLIAWTGAGSMPLFCCSCTAWSCCNL